MIEYKSGDILQERTSVFVNTVNCVGVMGRGLALRFKKTFPTISKRMPPLASIKKYALERGNAIVVLLKQRSRR